MAPYRQGWTMSLVAFTLCVSALSACDEQIEEPTSFEEGFEAEQDYSPNVDEYIYQEDEEVSATDGEYADPDREAFFDSDEEYVYEDNYYSEVEEYVNSPAPQLASVPPVEDVVSDEKWEEITEGVLFERTREKDKDEELPTINPGIDFGSGFETGLSTIAWVLVVVLIVGFIAWLIVRTKVDTSVDKVRDFTLTDELLAASKEELADALTQNLNAKDYRGAIRYRFGQLLQAMRKEGLLVWVPGRTNAEYQSNLQNPFFTPFGVLAKAFSYALYSGRDTTLAHYEDFAQNADAFLALVSPLSPKPNAR